MRRALMYASVMALGPLATATAADQTSNPRDTFFWLGELNKASLVMTVETGIVPPALGAKIAHAVAQVLQNGNKPGAARPSDYLQLEPLIVALAGPDATRMHSGRSRQDIIPTILKLEQRDRLLDFIDALNGARAKFIELAAKNAEVIVPAYTNGVQAQPTTWGHYLLGYQEAFTRDVDRAHEAWSRLNLSPLGAAALGTSSFPVDRNRLAILLGFDAPVQNSYDAGQLAPMDTGIELTSIAANFATTTGSFAQDIYAQYHQTSPWIFLQEGALTGPSSIMPQKRNPVALYTLRMHASETVGAAEAFLIMSHNVDSGMPDYKRGQLLSPASTLGLAKGTADQLQGVLAGLVIDAERAAAEVDADYSTTTELADTLQREADIPFRLGHHFASELVTFGRSNHLKPADIPFNEIRQIYADSAKAAGVDPNLPLDEQTFRRALSARGMMKSAKGLGGPQPAEVARMLNVARERLDHDLMWSKQKREGVRAAEARLQYAFDKVENEQ